MPVRGCVTWPLHGRWALHVYDYEASLTRLGRTVTVRPGTATLSPPDCAMTFDGPADLHEHLYFIFHAGSQVDEAAARVLAGDGEGPPASALAPSLSLALLFELGNDWRRLWNELSLAIACQTVAPRRAEARLWDVLWQLRDRVERGVAAAVPGTGRPALARDAAHYIELHLQSPLRVADVATALGVTHSHLARVFHDAYGCTLVAYLRQRRVGRACDLIVGTDQPLKVIGAEVGLSDPQVFNKAVRRELGVSPSQLRSRDSTTAPNLSPYHRSNG